MPTSLDHCAQDTPWVMDTETTSSTGYALRTADARSTVRDEVACEDDHIASACNCLPAFQGGHLLLVSTIKRGVMPHLVFAYTWSAEACNPCLDYEGVCQCGQEV